MAQTVILQETELAFDYSEIMGGYSAWPYDPLFALEDGKEYTVVWDGKYHTLTAGYFDIYGGVYAIGNLALFGLGDDTGETFLAGVYPDQTNLFLSTEDKPAHTIAIYEGAADGPTDPGQQDGIIIRDYKGEETVESGVEGILLDTTDGGTRLFVDADSVPESVETTVELDFSGGAVEVTPADGQAFSKVGIPVPANLIPENIAEGVNIAGIIGALAAGGGAAKIATGTFTSAAQNTITHNLGVVPDFIIVFPNSTNYAISGTYITPIVFGFSKAMATKYAGLPGNAALGNSNVAANFRFRTYSYYIEDAPTSMYPTCIRAANEETFRLDRDSSAASIPLSTSMRWIAVGGLT